MNEELRIIYKRIKSHEYRRSGTRVKGYAKLLETLSDVFVKALLKWSKEEGIAFPNMIHDFNCGISRIGTKYWNNNLANHLEQCLGTIHLFLDTGKIEKFWTYYSGCNKYDCDERSQRWILDKRKKRYTWVFDRKQFKAIVEEIERKRPEMENPDGLFSMYTKDRLKYFKARLRAGR